ncbi:MAG: HAD family hydrolase [Rhodospirillaceae bacterium]|nr:HAD family hydrolase [Rhodospirillaceae bacterium]|tara:strand:- start:11827 stop:12486 length:660 start_codon:yes stop_codon:yes gene_type:complete
MRVDLTRPKAVIFDWDNTLVDTWPVIHDSMNTTLDAMGHPLWTIEETKVRVRRSLREAFPDLFGDQWERARGIFYKRFRQIHLKRLEVIKGAEDLLKTLREKDIYLGVVSNKSGENLRREADHLGWNHYFGQIIGATDAEKDKPAVEPVQMALNGSGINPGRQVWFVGDTKIDMECAYNSGCLSILISKSVPKLHEFAEFMPELHFSSCELLTALASDI